MKIILVLFACFVAVVVSQLDEAVIADNSALLAKKPLNECNFCSNGINKAPCKCSYSALLRRKYACGPACDALGWCCDTRQCPSCQSTTENPTSDSNCFCPKSWTRIFRKYPCGPACTAAGYCCDLQVATISPIENPILL